MKRLVTMGIHRLLMQLLQPVIPAANFRLVKELLSCIASLSNGTCTLRALAVYLAISVLYRLVRNHCSRNHQRSDGGYHQHGAGRSPGRREECGGSAQNIPRAVRSSGTVVTACTQPGTLC